MMACGGLLPEKINGKPRHLALALLLISLAAHTQQAQAEDIYNYHIYAGGFYLIPDNDRVPTDEDGNFGWQVNLGKRLSESWWLEGHGFGDTIETGNSAGTDFYQYGLGLDLQYAWGDRDELTPYVLIGGGGVRNDVVPSSDDETTVFGNIGLGLTKRFEAFDLVRFRVEARAVYDDFLSGLVDYRIGGGIEVALGSPKSKAIPPEPQVVIKEVPVEVEKVVVQTVAAVEPDQDGDTVPDSRDKCPNTLPGAKVDADGCVIEQTLTLREVTFDFNSSRLTLNAQRLLDNVVEFLRAEPNVGMRISGHTDSKGADAYNLKLSKARAASVKSYLTGKGIDAGRLSSEGYGEQRPVASNDTEQGREANRRVEFEIKTGAK